MTSNRKNVFTEQGAILDLNGISLETGLARLGPLVHGQITIDLTIGLQGRSQYEANRGTCLSHFCVILIKRDSSIATGDPGSLCVGKYREHIRRSLGLKIC